MKIFERDDNTSFVDDNNVLGGFDNSEQCCEDFGWCLIREFPVKVEAGDNGINTDGFQFDPYYQSHNVPGLEISDEGGVVLFRLTKDSEIIYLTLWNFHNGYYSHGFHMERSGVIPHEGDL